MSRLIKNTSSKNLIKALNKNIQNLIIENDFKRLNNDTVPTIEKGNVTIKSVYGPFEYDIVINSKDLGLLRFNKLWEEKYSKKSESEKSQIWQEHFNGYKDFEEGSVDQISFFISKEIEFIKSELPGIFE